MARIRSIKPAFFRDEDLQDLERVNPGKFIMLVFAGLWCQCDKAGNFEWKPRSLKLDILPFLDFDMEETLGILQQTDFIERYSVDGKEYGHVPKFLEHQRISGKEAQDPATFPGKQREKTRKQRGSTGEAPETAGREGNGVQERKGKDKPSGKPSALEIEFEQWWAEYPRREAKADALKAFLKARDKAQFGQLLSAASAYAKKPDLDPKYTKLPATWLNKECWLDDIAEQKTQSDTLTPTSNPEQWAKAVAFAKRALAENIAWAKTSPANAKLMLERGEITAAEAAYSGYGAEAENPNVQKFSITGARPGSQFTGASVASNARRTG